ncbi:hypothetical protein C2G38_2246205 [Gigaspora rosea]|uniref:Uncharacterized protein n=1 Tax=Gigaspora rosea TaxID=44941 RepID=A0A397V9Y9_9GLOM|nr:hypothetical protein C2G38_2246205 [Gigaspora rosea]
MLQNDVPVMINSYEMQSKKYFAKDLPGLSWLETKEGIRKSTNRLDDILCLTENGNQRVQQIHRKESDIQAYSSFGFVLWELSNTT